MTDWARGDDLLPRHVAVPGAAGRDLAARAVRRAVARHRRRSSTCATRARRRTSSTPVEASLADARRVVGREGRLRPDPRRRARAQRRVGRVRRGGPRAEQGLRRRRGPRVRAHARPTTSAWTLVRDRCSASSRWCRVFLGGDVAKDLFGTIGLGETAGAIWIYARWLVALAAMMLVFAVDLRVRARPRAPAVPVDLAGRGARRRRSGSLASGLLLLLRLELRQLRRDVRRVRRRDHPAAVAVHHVASRSCSAAS